MKILIDTNALVSAFLFGGRPLQILEGVVSGKLTLCISEPLFGELQNVLSRPKFGLAAHLVQGIATELSSLATWIAPVNTIDVIKSDPFDNRVLECAIAARTDFIVSGDRHLLDLGHYKEIPIVDPNRFLSMLRENR